MNHTDGADLLLAAARKMQILEAAYSVLKKLQDIRLLEHGM